MRLARCAALSLFALPLFFETAACTRTKPAPGGLMVAVETDMNAPKDVGALGLYVSSGGQVIFAHEELVAPTGEVHFPATLAVVGAKTPGATVKIRVVAFKVSDDRRTVSARVVRDAITTLPLERQALLRLPILWLSDGSATGQIPPESLGIAASSAPVKVRDFNPFVDVVSTCPVGQTDVAGACVDANVDSASLPTFSPTDVFGAEGNTSSGACFSVTTCFANRKDVALASGADGCTATLPQGLTTAKVNVAVRLPPGSDGVCTSVECLVALDQDPAYGWSALGTSTVKLPPTMCTKLAARPDSGLVVSDACEVKTSKAPSCSPATVDPSGNGSVGDGGTVSPNGGELLDNSEPGPVDIKVDGDNVYFVAAGGRLKKISKYRDATGIFPGKVENIIDAADPIVGYRVAVTSSPIGNGQTFFGVSTLSKNVLRLGTFGAATQDLPGQTFLGGVAMLGSELYWLAGTELRSCDVLAGCVPATRIQSLTADALASDETSGDVFIGETNGNVALYSSKDDKLVFNVKAAGTVGALAIGGQWGVFTVPPAAETGTGSIYKILRTGGTPELLAENEAIGVDAKQARVPHSIATDGRYVYWTTRDGVRAINIDGGAPVDLATAMPRPRGITVDDVHVYWTCLGAAGEPHGYVYRKTKY